MSRKKCLTIILAIIILLLGGAFVVNNFIKNTARQKYLSLVSNHNLVETFLSGDQIAMDLAAKQNNLIYQTIGPTSTKTLVIWINSKVENQVITQNIFETLPKIIPKITLLNRQLYIVFPIINDQTEKGVILFAKI